MIWDGETIYTIQDFRPITIPAIKWTIVSNGNYKGSDRGTTEDIYESAVKFRGMLAELTTLETVLNDNHDEFTATFGTGEEVFGMDVDYSGSLTVAVVKYGKIKKVAFKVYEMALRLRLVSSPSFIGTASITDLRKSTHKDSRESRFNISKTFTYDRDMFVSDGYSGSKQGEGLYSASFSQTNSEMKAIRRYLLTTARAATLTNFFNSADPPFDNLLYPFGTNAGGGPFSVKVIEWKDGGRIDPNEWTLSITFARVF